AKSADDKKAEAKAAEDKLVDAAIKIESEKTQIVENTAEKPAEKTAEKPAAKKVEKPQATPKKVEAKTPTVEKKAETVEKPIEQQAAASVDANGEVVKDKAQIEREALARASARALAIENRLKKYYSENPRENTNQGNRGYNNNNNSNSGTYNNSNNSGYNNNRSQPQGTRPPRLDKDGKPIPFTPRPNGYQGNNFQPNYQGGNNNYQGNNGGQRPPYGQRPTGGFNGGGFDKDKDTQSRPGMAAKKPMGKPPMAGFTKVEPAKQFGNKNKTKGADQDKKGMNKRTLIRKGFIVENSDEFDEKMGSKKLRPRKSKALDIPQVIAPPIVISNAIVTKDIIQIKELSEKIGVTAAEITKKLFAEGIMKTVNESIDFTMAEYIAAMYNITLEYKKEETAEEVLFKNVADDDDDENLITRPPVVTVMGHVDHGKTSLLDAIKNSHVTTGEAGGITQHIGAYSVEINGRKITFIDTPGHEAFTSMRKRGAQITDIAILVVAADDGVMPQTVEAINHIKAAGVEMIVAINKMDKPNANKDKIMQQLVDYEVLSEEWGGETIMVPVSAQTHEGIDKLLESILLVADVKELRANPNKKASGVVIEAQLDKGKGPMATMLVQNGTLKVGDTVISGFATGRIRAMIDDKGRNLSKAGPSQAVSILGLSEVPEAGERIVAVEDDKMSRAVLEERVKRSREAMLKNENAVSLEDVFKKFSEGQIKGLNLIVKADVQGSVEAVKQSLLKLSNEEVTVKIIHGGVGAINESDVMLASTTSAIIIGFNVRPDAKTKAYAEVEKVEIRTYRIIYDAIEDIQKSLKGMLAPTFKETILGNIEIRDVFKITGAGTIGGGYVTSGKVQRNSKVRIVRDGVVVHEGEMCSLKRFKDDVKDVAQGYECGVGIQNFNDLKVGDIIECSIMEEIKR
ncbi:MAG: translation initiation factor IF-2, partial [Clostridia bacterium]